MSIEYVAALIAVSRCGGGVIDHEQRGSEQHAERSNSLHLSSSPQFVAWQQSYCLPASTAQTRIRVLSELESTSARHSLVSRDLSSGHSRLAPVRLCRARVERRRSRPP